MSRRTVVGSGPARNPLPFVTDAEKHEAIERAIKHYRFWQSATPETSVRAPADWLPDELGGLDLAELRELLRGMPPRDGNQEST